MNMGEEYPPSIGFQVVNGKARRQEGEGKQILSRPRKGRKKATGFRVVYASDIIASKNVSKKSEGAYDGLV